MRPILSLHAPHLSDEPAESSGAELALEITRGRARRAWRPIEQKAFLIGSADDCDLVLADPRIGSVHAYVLRSDEKATIRWMGEGPEVTVNGESALRAIPLVDGDEIRTGPYAFRVHHKSARVEPAPDLREPRWVAHTQSSLTPAPHAALETIRCLVYPGQSIPSRRTGS